MNVKIVADSTCDLSADLIEKYDITIIPLCIVMGENSYFDGIETTPEEIYKWADANKTTPKTAAVTIDNATSLLKPFMDEGREIVFFGISTQTSPPAVCHHPQRSSPSRRHSAYRIPYFEFAPRLRPQDPLQ